MQPSDDIAAMAAEEEQPEDQEAKERSVVRSFEQQRRLIAARTIGTTFGSLLALLIVILLALFIRGILGTLPSISLFLTAGVLAFCVGLNFFGVVAAQGHRLQVAVFSVIVATNISIVLTTIFWALLLARGLSPVSLVLFAATGVAIILAGELGEPWTILVTTAGMNALVVALVIFAPVGKGALSQFLTNEKLLATILALSIQWVVAAISLAAARNYRNTLQALGKAYLQVQQLDSLKDQFITNINHELRTPVMTLQSYIEYLRLSRHEMPAEEEEEMFSRASKAGYNLATLLTSILDVRRIDQRASDFVPEPVPVLDAIDKSLLLLDPRESGYGVHELQIRIPKSVVIWGESVRVQQILINLISNAIKYSGPGTPIEISAHLASQRAAKRRQRHGSAMKEQPMIEIQVHDHGLGIPPQQIPLLFNRFVRLPRDLASTIVGNGLGLYLCRVLAEAMGGEIRVESQGIPGEGSTFFVLLPAVNAAAGTDTVETTQPRLKVIAIKGNAKE